MDVLTLCPFPVGIARFGTRAVAAAVVVKVTLALEGGIAALAPEQEPLSLDRPSPSGAPHELSRASDFVPYKPRADVLLVGHARDEGPSAVVAVRFVVGDMLRRAVAIAPRPMAEIPLSDEYLRAQPSKSSAVVSVGPRAPTSPERASLLGGRELDASGAPAGDVDAGFDFAFFNAAPASQQVDRVASDTRLVLHGLLAGADRWEATLPGIEPVAFALGPGGLELVPLACDTLLVDSDRARCVLVFRGRLPEHVLARGYAVVVAQQRRGDRLDPARVQRDLPRARKMRAMEASDLVGRAAVPEVKRRGLATWMSGARVIEDEPSRDALTGTRTALRDTRQPMPFRDPPPPGFEYDDEEPPTPRPGLSLGRGAPLGKTALGARAQLTAPETPPPAALATSGTGTVVMRPEDNPLRALAPRKDDAAQKSDRDGRPPATQTLLVGPEANPLRALPFNEPRSPMPSETRSVLAPPPVEAPKGGALVAVETLALDPAANPLRAILPFSAERKAPTPPAMESSAPAPVPGAADDRRPRRWETVVPGVSDAPRAVLPFVASGAAPPPSAPSAPVSPAPAPPWRRSMTIDPTLHAGAALPFKSAVLPTGPALAPSAASFASADAASPARTTEAAEVPTATSSAEVRAHGARLVALWSGRLRDATDAHALRAEHAQIRELLAREAKSGKAAAALALLASIRAAQRGA